MLRCYPVESKVFKTKVFLYPGFMNKSTIITLFFTRNYSSRINQYLQSILQKWKADLKLHRYLQRNNFLLTSDCEDKALTVIINSIRAVWWKTAIIRSIICKLQVPYHKIIRIIDSIAFNFVFFIWSVWKSKHHIITVKIMRSIKLTGFKAKNKKKCLVASLFIFLFHK